MTTLKCIAVDDEPLALGMVAAFIEQTPFLSLVGKYSSGVEALRSLHEHPDLDLIFLDIQMPELTGLELARVLDRGQPGTGPRIIFTTAFNQYALDGYRVDALDYLVKPFSPDQLRDAFNHAQAIFNAPRVTDAAAERPHVMTAVIGARGGAGAQGQ